MKRGVLTQLTVLCHYNTKLASFNSKSYQPGTGGVNAFSQDWAFPNNWLICPPSYLTARLFTI